jgi:hypothetical protein
VRKGMSPTNSQDFFIFVGDSSIEIYCEYEALTMGLRPYSKVKIVELPLSPRSGLLPIERTKHYSVLSSFNSRFSSFYP